MAADIKAALKAFDGKDTGPLLEAADSISPNTQKIAGLIKNLQAPELVSQGASWILKRWWESGWKFSEQESAKLIEALLQAQDWQLRLHLLQILPGLVITQPQHKALYYRLCYSLEDKNKFVRAWTYNGLAELAKQYPQYRDEVVKLFDLALEDEAASVKARIRNITIACQ